MSASQKTTDDTFAALEQAAATGVRCPSNEPHGPLHGHAVHALARDGRIRIEVYRHNWRVVTILTGPHAGKKTQACPAGGKPYMVVAEQTVRQRADEKTRPGPSAPRDYSGSAAPSRRTGP